MKHIIQISHLSKYFRQPKSLFDLMKKPFKKTALVTVLSNINLTINKGEIFALLGPNGAGKTTLIKTLCALILPDQGKITVSGYDLLKQERLAKTKIGLAVGEERSLYWRLTGRQNLQFFGAMYNIPKIKLNNKIKELNSILEIDDLDKLFENYSAGMKNRIGLARCLINDPEIIFMDEPTKSLDPGAANKFRIFIKETLVKKLAKTVFFATHQIDEAAELAERIAIISQGRIKAQGKIEDINIHLGLSKDTPLKELYLKITS